MYFKILGPLEVEDDGRPVAVRGAKQRALLAMLLLNANELISRDGLIDELWGERAPETAAHRLEEHVSRLRKLLHRNGETPVVTRPSGYLLRVSDNDLDVAQFERLVTRGRNALRDAQPEQAATLLREALALWRGRPLEDVDLDSVAWPEIRRLDERRAVAYEKLIDAELAQGRHAEVVDELEALVSREPLRERLRVQQMLALYRSGRQADALATYQEARRALAGELGLDPGPELQQLERAILRQDSSLDLFPAGDGHLPPIPRAPAGNLPRPATSLVGRERELGEILALLASSRFITLTGPGGSGKTRLALEAAYRAVADFPAGVFWVPLAPLRDPSLVVKTLAQVLGARDGVASHIGDRRLLLLADNFEQVAEAGADLASLVTACPNLHLLVTSRELLHLGAETEYQVLPLSGSEAIELFCRRSRARPDDTVAELCRRLDNLPLAIEYAAARTTVLSPRQILERISQRLDLLKGGCDSETRQLTLRTTLEWSHDLLSVEEQRLFARLAVFAGGWTLEAAEEVAGADLDTLQSLVEKSLVQHAGERFWMLETTREFALEQLEVSDEAEILHRLHAAYFTELAERAEPELRGPQAARWNATLSAELDNLRASLSLARDVGDGPVLLRLAAALGRNFWPQNGHLEEGRAWVDQALASSEGPAEARARALLGMAMIANLQLDRETQSRYSEALLAFAREHDDADLIFWGLMNVGMASSDPDRTRALYEQSARVAREAGDDLNLAVVTLNRGALELSAASYEEAFALSERAADMLDRIGHPIAREIALTNGGLAALELGRLGDAAERLGEALQLAVELGVTILNIVGALAALELARSRLERAARLTGIAEALCDEGFVFEDIERSFHERTLTALERALDKETLAAALAAGHALPRDEALAYALEA